MNNKLFTMGAGLLFAATAVAGPAGVKDFPAPMAPAVETPAQVAQGIQRAPLNPEMNLGTKIFGYTTDDFYRTKNYMNLFTTAPRTLNKLNPIIIQGTDELDERPFDYYNFGGVWAGDQYYTYRMYYYTAGYWYLNDWMKVDTQTGESESMVHYHFNVYNNSQGYTMPQSLLWNPNRPNNLQVIAQNNDGTTTSAIWTVDRATGMFGTKVANLPEYYFSATYDYENQLYAIRWDYKETTGEITGTVLDVYDISDFSEPVSSTKISVDGKPWYIYYQNNLTMDYTTGELWWAAMQIANYPQYHAELVDTPTVETRLIKINPDNGQTENLGAIGMNEGIGGMYVEYVTAEDIKAPAKVNNLNFTIDTTGATKVTLDWTNPTTTWGRKTLSNLSEVYIYRDSQEGEPVAKLAATGKEGQKMTWTDENATNGIHTYYVRGVNNAGQGVPSKIDAFVGHDVPGPVVNLTAETLDGKTINLSWSKPERGDNDGWFDDSDLTYNITRLPDNKNLGSTKELTFHDDTMDEALLFSYLVTATSADGTGSAAESNKVLAGKSIVLPFSTNFENQVEADRFTALDKNYDGRTWEYAYNMGLIGTKSMYNGHDKYGVDDVLVSPSLLVEEGKTYKVVYTIRHFSYGESGQTLNRPYRILGGTEATIDGMNKVLADVPENESPVFEQATTYVAYFTAEATGEYYVGLEDLTKDELSTGTYVEAFSVEEAPDDDLQAVSISAHRAISAIEDNTFTVELYNNGSNAQSNYTVKVAYLNDENEETVIAQTKEVPEIAGRTTDYVEVLGYPTELGEFEIYAIVELAGDGNPANDRSPKLKVTFDEAPALNFTVDSYENKGEDSNLPMAHYYRYSATQTIYSPDMTAFDRIFKGKNPAITRMAWEYNGRQLAGGSNIEVYLSQTDYKGFQSGDVTGDATISNAMIALGADAKPLFAGEVDILPGDNYMVVDLDDEYSFDPEKSILVTVLKDDATNAGTYPVGFKVFDNDWYSAVMHSYLYQGTTAFNIVAPEGRMNVNASAPVLHLAVKSDNSGINEVVLTGKGAVYYNALSATVEAVDFAMASVEVYTLGGQLVKTVAVAEGATSAAIDCAKGLYLLKVNGVDGSSLTLKAVVK